MSGAMSVPVTDRMHRYTPDCTKRSHRIIECDIYVYISQMFPSVTRASFVSMFGPNLIKSVFCIYLSRVYEQPTMKLSKVVA
jgi:hypothetical protein